jgi:hypothetical protein
MKNFILTFAALFIFTIANGQKFVKPAITENDRQHLLTVFNRTKNPDAVWRDAEIKILKEKNLPQEMYSTSVARDGKFVWEQFGPMEGDTVMVYKGIYLKKYNSLNTYYLQAKEFSQPQYANNSQQSAQKAQKQPKPQGDGKGFEKAAVLVTGAVRLYGEITGRNTSMRGGNTSLFGGNDSGLGGNTSGVNVVGYQGW